VPPARLSGSTKEENMAKEINCPCGETVSGSDDDELVTNAESHMRDKHPEMVGNTSRDEILAMAHEA
jgi:predicted small metal-binding protein